MFGQRELNYRGRSLKVPLRVNYLHIDDLVGEDGAADGSCRGGEFLDEVTGRTVTKSVVKADIQVTITKTEGLYVKDTNQILLEKRKLCDMPDRTCNDPEMGTFTWDWIVDECSTRYMKIYPSGSADSGPAMQWTPSDKSGDPAIIVIDDPAQKHSIGLVLKDQDDSCGFLKGPYINAISREGGGGSYLPREGRLRGFGTDGEGLKITEKLADDIYVWPRSGQRKYQTLKLC